MNKSNENTRGLEKDVVGREVPAFKKTKKGLPS